MIKFSLKLFFGMFFFLVIFLTDHKYISQNFFVAFGLSISYVIYVCKVISCIFNIHEYFYLSEYTQLDKFRKITFDIKKKIYIDSIILYLTAFLIFPYIWYHYFNHSYVIFYVTSILLLIPSITIIQSA